MQLNVVRLGHHHDRSPQLDGERVAVILISNSNERPIPP
jgi:hypothetical protein